MDILRGAKDIVLWLSGALAAITAALYAAGYIVSLSNLRLLGWDPLMVRSEPLLYLQHGGGFVVYCLESMLGMLLSFVVAAAAVGVIYTAAKTWRAKVRAAPSGLEERNGKSWTQRYLYRWRTPLYGVLLFLALLYLLLARTEIMNVLAVSNLLFDDQSAVIDGDSNVRQLLLDKPSQHRDTQLDIKFRFAELSLLAASASLYLSWKLVSTFRYRVVLVAPFVIILGLLVIYLPMVYGIVVLPNEYSTVSLRGKDEEPIAHELYLINQTEDAFVVWDASVRRLIWMPQASVAKLEVGPRRSIPLAAKAESSTAQ